MKERDRKVRENEGERERKKGESEFESLRFFQLPAASVDCRLSFRSILKQKLFLKREKKSFQKIN